MLEKLKKLLQKRQPSRKFIVIFIIPVLISLSFYWFWWRPVQIRSYCNGWAGAGGSAVLAKYGLSSMDFEEKYGIPSSASLGEYNTMYESCLHRKGLE